MACGTRTRESIAAMIRVQRKTQAPEDAVLP
jgi:hypothetical protein